MNKFVITLTLAALFPLVAMEISPRAAQASEIEASAQARTFPYCRTGGPSGGTRCLYTSRAQCMKSTRATGGTCIPNARAAARR